MKRFNITVGCILFALLALANEEDPVLEEGCIGLSTSFKTIPGLRDHDLPRCPTSTLGFNSRAREGRDHY